MDQEEDIVIGLLHPEDGGTSSFRNVGYHPPKATDLHSRDFETSYCVKFGLSLF